MPSLRPLILALVSGACLRLDASTHSPCTRAVARTAEPSISRQTANVPTSCSNSNCHTNNPANNVKNIQKRATARRHHQCLGGTDANAEMVALDLVNNLPLSAQDIDAILPLTFLRHVPGTPRPTCRQHPRPSSSARRPWDPRVLPIAVTVTNVGTANATSVSLTNSNATEFIVSGSTCTGTIVA